MLYHEYFCVTLRIPVKKWPTFVLLKSNTLFLLKFKQLKKMYTARSQSPPFPPLLPSVTSYLSLLEGLCFGTSVLFRHPHGARRVPLRISLFACLRAPWLLSRISIHRAASLQQLLYHRQGGSPFISLIDIEVAFNLARYLSTGGYPRANNLLSMSNYVWQNSVNITG